MPPQRPICFNLKEFACNSRHLGPRRVKKGGSGTRSGHLFAWHRWLPWTAVDRRGLSSKNSWITFFADRRIVIGQFTRKVRPKKAPRPPPRRPVRRDLKNTIFI